MSAREEQVLGLAADGLLDKQIAASLGLTENTLRTYWRRVRSKLGEVPRGALVALYVRGEHGGLPVEDGVGWHIDLRRNVVVYSSERGILPQGETDLEKAIEIFHPEDRARIWGLLRALTERDLPPITYMARILTPYGVETTCSMVWPVRDAGGKIVRIEGRHVPILDLTVDTDGAANIGTYRRDLDTGVVEIDEGLASIFRVRPGEPNLTATIIGRFCPEFRKTMRGMVDGMIAAGHPRRQWTARICFGDGESLWVSSQSRVEEKDGRPTAFVATVVAFR